MRADAGHHCPRCEGTLHADRGIEVGHIFQLGTKYSAAMGCVFLDDQGKQQPVVMGCYGIGVSRMAAACIEQNYDERGILWPAHIAPYHVHLLNLTPKDEAVTAACDALYERLQREGVEVFYDDRNLRPGEKFGDADLIGLPVRLCLSKRTMEQNQVEYKLRTEKESKNLSTDEAVAAVKAVLAE
jgi:prolyl-tRNA synthetase